MCIALLSATASSPRDRSANCGRCALLLRTCAAALLTRLVLTLNPCEAKRALRRNNLRLHRQRVIEPSPYINSIVNVLTIIESAKELAEARCAPLHDGLPRAHTPPRRRGDQLHRGDSRGAKKDLHKTAIVGIDVQHEATLPLQHAHFDADQSVEPWERRPRCCSCCCELHRRSSTRAA